MCREAMCEHLWDSGVEMARTNALSACRAHAAIMGSAILLKLIEPVRNMRKGCRTCLPGGNRIVR
jgi:hypothetical protein